MDRRTLGDLWAFLIDNSLLLVIGAVAGLLWANAAPGSYAYVTRLLHFAVNDVGMVFFFAIAAKEVVEATLPDGPLASPRRAAVPVWAAVGGMIGPAMIYIALALWAGEPALVRGWAIPCATDIAFSYLVARFIFGSGHPAIPFLLLLAIADDALGLAILAIAYPTGTVRLDELAVILAGALAVAWCLKNTRHELLALRARRRHALVGGISTGRSASGTCAGTDHSFHPARGARSRLDGGRGADTHRSTESVRALVAYASPGDPLFLRPRQRGRAFDQRRGRYPGWCSPLSSPASPSGSCFSPELPPGRVCIDRQASPGGIWWSPASPRRLDSPSRCSLRPRRSRTGGSSRKPRWEPF